ncbi:hypothetical protein YDYSY3_01690 [Paenibacillus chitinolyticus]|nr:hypothetical protein YDYSY3_01690 [Paenibacillus chitinolyticus]
MIKTGAYGKSGAFTALYLAYYFQCRIAVLPVVEGNERPFLGRAERNGAPDSPACPGY